MSSSKTKPDLNEVVQTVWLSGTRLGVIIICFFIAGAALAFLLLGITGMSASLRGFFALMVGPVLGGAAFYYGVWRRLPNSITDPSPDDES